MNGQFRVCEDSKRWFEICRVLFDPISNYNNKRDVLNILKSWSADPEMTTAGIEATLILLEVELSGEDMITESMLKYAYSMAVIKTTKMLENTDNLGTIFNIRDLILSGVVPELNSLRKAADVLMNWLGENYWFAQYNAFVFTRKIKDLFDNFNGETTLQNLENEFCALTNRIINGIKPLLEKQDVFRGFYDTPSNSIFYEKILLFLHKYRLIDIFLKGLVGLSAEDPNKQHFEEVFKYGPIVGIYPDNFNDFINKTIDEVDNKSETAEHPTTEEILANIDTVLKMLE